jgi:DNA modification methylase
VGQAVERVHEREVIEAGLIYNEDCLKVMGRIDDGSIDLIVTDPPYGLNFNDGDLAHNREKVFGGDVSRTQARPIMNDGEEEANTLFRAFLGQAKRILKAGACCCCCCGGGGGPLPLFARWTLWMDEAVGFKQAVVWDKGGLGMGLHYRRNYEFMLVAQKPGRACIWNGGNSTPNIVRIPKIIPSLRQHPTEKPVQLMEHFVRLHSNPGDLVLDPFAGRGSTLIAAEKTGRQWVGCELDPKHYVDALKRMEEFKAQEVLAFAV